MPSGITHVLAGGMGGAVGSIMIQSHLRENKNLDPGHILLSTGAALTVSRLSDILEPATSPNHRAFFHSFFFASILVFAAVEIWKKLKEMREERKRLGITEISGWELLGAVGLVLIGAILLHLVMDGFTKKGLPAV